MIIKRRDASTDTIARLERSVDFERDPMRRTALRGAASRMRADTTSADACALIDASFANAVDWAVLHDLRLSLGASAVRLNHLLVSDRLEFVCIDTRYLRHGLESDASGAFRAFSRYGVAPIASPLIKAARDVRVLGDALGEANLVPRRPGVGPRAKVRAVVLTDPALRIGVPSGTPRDAVGVYPADALFPMLWKRERRVRPFGRVSRETLEATCAEIAAMHRPSVPEALLGAA